MSQDAKIDRLIESLVSGSKSPLLDDAGVPRATASKLGLDIQEQRRVADVIHQIDQMWNEEVWDKLIARCDDGRYCLTTINDNEFVTNWTVGRVCSYLTERQILDGINEILRSIPPAPTREHIGYSVDLFDGKSILEWRTIRKEKRFNDLQVELTSAAIDHLKRDKNLSETERDQVVGKLNGLRRRYERTVQSQFVRIKLVGEEFSLPK
jgi:hypothetical protein